MSTKEILKKGLQDLYESIQQGREKKDYEKQIIFIEKALSDFYKEGDYVYSCPEECTLFKKTDAERLEEAKMAKQQKTKQSELPYRVEHAADLISTWWKKQGFSHCREFKIMQSGVAKINLSLMLSSVSTFSRTPLKDRSKNENLKEQLLQNGFMLNQKASGFKVIDNDNNKMLLKKLLKSTLGEDTNVKFSSLGNELSEIECYVYDLAFLNALKKEDLPEETVVETIITEDDIVVIKKDVKSFYNAIVSIDSYEQGSTFLTKTIYPLLLSYFSDICGYLQIETNLSKEYHMALEPIRKINQEIDEIHNQMVDDDRFETLLDDARNYFEQIKNIFIESMNCCINKCYLTHYRKLCLDLSWIENEYFAWDIDKHILSKVDKSKFDTEIDEDDYNHLILNDHNQKEILAALSKIMPDVELSQYELSFKNNKAYIKNIHCLTGALI